MTHKPVVARTLDGAEYGFVDAKTARRMLPDGEIVRYQSGETWEEPKPKPATKSEAKGKGESS